MNFYIHIFFELVIGFFALLILTKILGKTTINQISAFDFIAVLVLGELVGAAMYVKNVNLLHIIFAMIVWGGLIYLTAFITQKFRKSRKFFEGAPSIVIANGSIDYHVMKGCKLDLNQLTMQLRIKGVFSFNEVEYAIIEENGDISVLKKQQYDCAINKDLNIVPQRRVLSYFLIMDGEVIDENLKEIKRDSSWLDMQVTSANFNSTKDVFVAEWSEIEGLYIQGY